MDLERASRFVRLIDHALQGVCRRLPWSRRSQHDCWSRGYKDGLSEGYEAGQRAAFKSLGETGLRAAYQALGHT